MNATDDLRNMLEAEQQKNQKLWSENTKLRELGIEVADK